ncbi:MAG: alpha/beta hydrolase [Acidobacteria bacterium]|nr:alpha/beta hydrolase [Acidobacteriota bacterium]
MNVIKTTTRVLELSCPPLAKLWAKTLFFRPTGKRRAEPQGFEARWMSVTRDGGSKRLVRVYTTGSGPAVLLLHGWGGSAQSFESLGTLLAGQGYRAIAFDGPAHGVSPGSTTNLKELADIARFLDQLCGGFHLVVGHSFGGMVAAFAISRGLRTHALALIAAPNATSFILDQYQTIIGASHATRSFIQKQVEAITAIPVEAANVPDLIHQASPQKLIIHDIEDQRVPISEARANHRAWQDAQYLETTGLGHSRILRDADIGQQILAFANRSGMALSA